MIPWHFFVSGMIITFLLGLMIGTKSDVIKIICQILLMFVKQIFEDFENLENKKESNLNKTCCCRPAVNSYNESGQIYLYNSIARA